MFVSNQGEQEIIIDFHLTINRINTNKTRWIRMNKIGIYSRPWMTDLAYVLPIEDV
jgi:hypothetical protein